MRRGKKFLLTLVFFVLVVFCLNATGAQEGLDEGSMEANGVTMNIVVSTLKGPSGLAAAKMVDDDFQPADDVSVEYRVLSSPLEAITRMTSGEIDAAFLPVNTAAKIYSKGLGFRLAAISGRGSLFLVSTDSSVNHWDDLRGRTIYLTGKGATPDYLLSYLSERNNLSVNDDVKLDFTSNPVQIVQLLSSFKADIAFIPQPFVMLALNKADARVVIDPQRELMDINNTDNAFPFTAFVISERLVNFNVEAARALVAALGDSIAWVCANPADAAVIVEGMGILSAKIAEPAIPLCAIEFSSAKDSKDDVLDFLQMFYEIDPRSIGGKLPDEEFFFY